MPLAAFLSLPELHRTRNASRVKTLHQENAEHFRRQLTSTLATLCGKRR